MGDTDLLLRQAICLYLFDSGLIFLVVRANHWRKTIQIRFTDEEHWRPRALIAVIGAEACNISI